MKVDTIWWIAAMSSLVVGIAGGTAIGLGIHHHSTPLVIAGCIASAGSIILRIWDDVF